MDRMLAARPLVRRVLVARVGENVEQAYRAPDGCGWRGGSTLCPILVLLAGGGLRRFSSVKSTTAGSLAVIPMEKDQSGESQFVGTHRGGQKSRPNEKSRGAKNPRFFFFLFFFFFGLFFLFKFVVGKSLLTRPFETKLFLYWPASRCADGARFFTWFAGSKGRTQCLFEKYALYWLYLQKKEKRKTADNAQKVKENELPWHLLYLHMTCPLDAWALVRNEPKWLEPNGYSASQQIGANRLPGTACANNVTRNALTGTAFPNAVTQNAMTSAAFPNTVTRNA